jgi:acyl-coenzyme A synthetase/AMP-(fatty) acid ligase
VRSGPLDDRAAWRLHGFDGDRADLIAAQSLPRAWAARWAAAPEAVVLRDTDTPWMTAGEVEQRTAAAAARLASAGIEPGDRVVMSCTPSVDLVLAHVAALRLGAIVVPVNTAFGPNEVGNVWNEARPKLAILDDPARLPEGRSCPASLDGLPAGGASPALDASRADDPAMLMFTSGTTGRPKGAI